MNQTSNHAACSLALWKLVQRCCLPVIGVGPRNYITLLVLPGEIKVEGRKTSV